MGDMADFLEGEIEEEEARQANEVAELKATIKALRDENERLKRPQTRYCGGCEERQRKIDELRDFLKQIYFWLVDVPTPRWPPGCEKSVTALERFLKVGDVKSIKKTVESLAKAKEINAELRKQLEEMQRVGNDMYLLFDSHYDGCPELARWRELTGMPHIHTAEWDRLLKEKLNQPQGKE